MANTGNFPSKEDVRSELDKIEARMDKLAKESYTLKDRFDDLKSILTTSTNLKDDFVAELSHP